MIFSDLPSPADPGSAEGGFAEARAGFAKAGNRFPPPELGLARVPKHSMPEVG
jgi:hypothetical protein